MATRALVVDDEKNIRGMLAACLAGESVEVREAANSTEARAAMAQPFDLAFVDLRLGRESGLDLIPELVAASPEADVIVITAFATIDTAVEAVKRGARDYLPKPFTPAQIRHLVAKTRERQGLRQQVETLRARLSAAEPDVQVTTRAPKMIEALELATQAAKADAPVLLRGESGTGKGLFARVIHQASPRTKAPFVTVNCPTLSEELLTSELFGHAKGSFTGAVRDQAGRVEMAEGGTLFLDEIAELSPPLQAKLLRFLQDKQFERLGENRTRVADVRVVAATNRDLEEDVRSGRFRRDLLYRLNVVQITLPPLRERPEDVIPLAALFLADLSHRRRQPPTLSPAAEHALASHNWPGNVRELRNVIERALIVSSAAVVEPGAFALPHAQNPEITLGADVTLDALEREHIQRVLARAQTEQEAARILGIDVSTLYRKRKRYEKDP